MRLKIRGGTVEHGQASLCASCKYATVVKGQSLRHEIIECGQLSSDHNLISFPVSSCSGYLNRQHPSIREMEDIAWVLRTDSKRKQIGFVQARELKPRDRYVLPEDEDWRF